MSDIPIIKPIKLKEYQVIQSKYDVASKLPIRSIILGPSGSGKSILLQNFILDIYKDCFSRVYILVLLLMLIIKPGNHVRSV